MRNKRLDYVDAAKALAIILVVFGHTTSGADDIKHLIYSFHVPVFFILYGFVVKLPPSPPPFKETVAKCFKRYLFPYFWMMVLCGGLNLEKAADYLNARQSILTRYEPFASWFLPCFFLSVLIYALIVRAGCRLFSGRRTLLFVAGASLLFLALGLRLNATRVWNAWFYYNEAFVGVGLIGIGLLFRKGWDALNADALPAAAAFGLSLVFAGILGYAAFSNGFVAMVLGQYGNRGLFLLSSVSGTLCLLLLSKSIHFKVHNTPPLSSLFWERTASSS